MLLQHKSTEVFADYHQFYLWDQGMNPLAPEEYSRNDVDNRMKVGPHVVVIQPDRDLTVPVEIEIHDSEPPYEARQWDHIAEASLHLPTGQLEVHQCTGGVVADFSVAKGWYRVRSFHGGLDSVYDANVEDADFYRVVLWPSAPAELLVVKQYARRR